MLETPCGPVYSGFSRARSLSRIACLHGMSATSGFGDVALAFETMSSRNSAVR